MAKLASYLLPGKNKPRQEAPGGVCSINILSLAHIAKNFADYVVIAVAESNNAPGL